MKVSIQQGLTIINIYNLMTVHKIYEAKTDRSEKRKQGRSCSIFYDLTPEATHHCSHNPLGYTQVKPYTRARIWGGENLWTPSADLTVPLRPSEIPPLGSARFFLLLYKNHLPLFYLR